MSARQVFGSPCVYHRRRIVLSAPLAPRTANTAHPLEKCRNAALNLAYVSLAAIETKAEPLNPQDASLSAK